METDSPRMRSWMSFLLSTFLPSSQFWAEEYTHLTSMAFKKKSLQVSYILCDISIVDL